MKILKNLIILFILIGASKIEPKDVRILIFNHLPEAIFCKYKKEVKNISKFYGARSIDVELKDSSEENMLTISGNYDGEFASHIPFEVLKHSLFLNSEKEGIELLRELHVTLLEDNIHVLPAFEYYARQSRSDLEMKSFFETRIKPAYDELTILSKKEN